MSRVQFEAVGLIFLRNRTFQRRRVIFVSLFKVPHDLRILKQFGKMKPYFDLDQAGVLSVSVKPQIVNFDSEIFHLDF